MPEREYFSLRYAIPGYTLILLVIGINHVPLLEILERTKLEAAFGAFLAFLSLFTGSALGFLVSQFWWWRYHRKGGLFGVPKFKEVLDVLIDNLDLSDHSKDRLKKLQKNEDKIKLIAVYDYVSHSEKEDGLLAYVERRWDMHHLLSSTMWSLAIGLAVGIYCRIFSEFFLFESSFSIPHVKNAELIALLSIVASVVLLIFVLHRGVQWNVSEYSPVEAVRIRDSVCAQKENIKKIIKDLFPNIVKD